MEVVCAFTSEMHTIRTTSMDGTIICSGLVLISILNYFYCLLKKNFACYMHVEVRKVLIKC
jgi:hypothetical protein